MAIKINWQDLQKRIINWQEVQKVMLNWNQIRPSSSPTPAYQIVWDFATAWASGQLPTGWVGSPMPTISSVWISSSLTVSGAVRTNLPSLTNAKKIMFTYNFRWAAFWWTYNLVDFSFFANDGVKWRDSVFLGGWESVMLILRSDAFSSSEFSRLLPDPPIWYNYLYTLTWEIDFINKTYTSSLTNSGWGSANYTFQIWDYDIANLKDVNSLKVNIEAGSFVTVSYVEISIFE